MKAIICGAGQYTLNLLGRLGERWHITLIDPSEQRLSDLLPKYQSIVRVLAGDASSPVLLEDAGLEAADYVLALTDNDKVNLAVAGFAREKGVPHILSLVHDFEMEEKFRELGVHTLLPGNMVGSTLYHYLQDPRIRVFSVAHGLGEMVEMEVTRDNWIAGTAIGVLDDPEWRLTGLFRNGELMHPIPDLTLQEGDRLILLGQRNFFRSVCSILACAHMPFPMKWGRGVLIVINGEDAEGVKQMLDESMYLLQNIRAGHVVILHHEESPDPAEHLASWTGRYDIRVHATEKSPVREIRRICQQENIGLVITRPFEKSFLRSLTRPETISLAHSLNCPILIIRHSHPYERILVPFNATPMSEVALETAIDLSEQLNATVDVAVVREPEFIHGNSPDTPPEDLFRRVREISHIHKVKIGEILREGNPVRELTDLAGEYHLMIVGSTSREKELLTPHVGELLTERTACSVLVIASE
ncbi:TrkA-N domain protein [Desulfonema ishimotonii]|uniref:Trk system potassium uptake protein TrkA n=1 Tax=Desulfonema ishimotonii TaxID=45657 RepID=A0A401G3V2_9BACT|nr:NAD-binding protein [Desulfonema ishimotonii]GBC63861.1 TrkA-N domain protein [Desulfonema ishimotonii]